jgi:hypothetical protein
MFFVHQQKKTGICFDVIPVVLLFIFRKHYCKKYLKTNSIKEWLSIKGTEGISLTAHQPTV